MQRIFIIAVLTVSTFLCACGESNEKTASREYVKASRKISEAQAAYLSADYAKALALCSQAQADVENIIMKYPETPVALKVVTDGDTRIGACSYSELNDVIIPRLATFTLKEMNSVELAWAIAMSLPPEHRDGALVQLAQSIINDINFDNSKQQMIIVCAGAITNSKSKGIVLQNMRDKLNPQTFDKANAPISIAIAPKHKIVDEKMFIMQAKSDASLVAYDMQAVENLRMKAILANDASENVRSEFSKALKSANENILKISAADMREKALASLAFAFSNFGDEHNAIAIAQTLKNPKLFADVFDAIAKQASSGKNYTLAIALASRLQTGKDKNDFLVELAKGVANQGLFPEATSIADMIKDSSAHNVSLANIANIALKNNDKKNFAATIAKIDLKSNDMSWVEIFADQSSTSKSQELLTPDVKRAFLTGKLASKLIQNGAPNEISNAVNLRALELYNDNHSDNLLKTVCRNMAALGDAKGAVANIALNMQNVNPEMACQFLCSIAEDIVAKDKPSALRAYELAANLANSLSSESRRLCAISLALSLQNSGVERPECAKILKPFLPAFK